MNIAEVVLKSGNRFDETASALQKELRRGREYEALWFAEDLAESGYDLYCWKRIVITAVEDVGLASLETVRTVVELEALWQRWRKNEKGQVRLPDFNIMALAVCSICRAPKSRQSDDLTWLMELDKKAGKVVPLPPYAQDGHTDRGKSKLMAQAKKEGKEFMALWNEEFYHDVARCNNPIEAELGPNGVNWSQYLMKKVKCDYEKYMAPILGVNGHKQGPWLPNVVVLNDATRLLKVESTEVKEKWFVVDLIAGSCECGGTFKDKVCFHLVHAQRRMANVDLKKAQDNEKKIKLAEEKQETVRAEAGEQKEIL